MTDPVGVAIIGCGNVAERYAQQLQTYAEVDLLGFADLDPARARDFAERFGGQAYADLDALLADPAVVIVVNLTIHTAHPEVIERCLRAGKHCHTEKPLAMSSADAGRLVALAEEVGLRLTSAPITYLGEGQETAWRQVRSGALGTVRLAYAEVNHGRIETWHPNPAPFYEIGVLWDVGVYPLTLLTAFLGPVRRVSAQGRLLKAERETKDGTAFTITTPDCWFAVLDFESGAVARLTANFYAKGAKGGGSIELHGDDQRLWLGDFQNFAAPVQMAPFGQDYADVAPVAEGQPGIEFARGVQELAQAIRADRPHRADASHAAHVIEIVEALVTSALAGGAGQEVTSDFVPPWPLHEER